MGGEETWMRVLFCRLRHYCWKKNRPQKEVISRGSDLRIVRQAAEFLMAHAQLLC